MNNSARAVAMERFEPDEDYYVIAKGEFINELSKVMNATVPDLINLGTRVRAYSPKSPYYSELMRLFDPCEPYTLTIKEAISRVNFWNAWAQKQDKLDAPSGITRRIFAQAEDCPDPDSITIVPPQIEEEKPKPTSPQPCIPDTIRETIVVIKPCLPDTLIYWRSKYYAHLGGIYTFGNGLGASAEIGVLTRNFHFGFIAGTGRRDIDNIQFWSHFAGIKAGWDFIRTEKEGIEKTRVGVGAQVGACLIKQSIITPTLTWSGTKFVPYAGAYLRASHMFSKHFGVFADVGFRATKLNATAQETLTFIKDDNGDISSSASSEKIEEINSYLPLELTVGLRWTIDFSRRIQ